METYYHVEVRMKDGEVVRATALGRFAAWVCPYCRHQMLAELDRQGTLAEAEYVPFSAVSGQGRADVLAWIGRALRPETVQTAASRPPP